MSYSDIRKRRFHRTPINVPPDGSFPSGNVVPVNRRLVWVHDDKRGGLVGYSRPVTGAYDIMSPVADPRDTSHLRVRLRREDGSPWLLFNRATGEYVRWEIPAEYDLFYWCKEASRVRKEAIVGHTVTDVEKRIVEINREELNNAAREFLEPFPIPSECKATILLKWNGMVELLWSTEEADFTRAIELKLVELTLAVGVVLSSLHETSLDLPSLSSSLIGFFSGMVAANSASARATDKISEENLLSGIPEL